MAKIRDLNTLLAMVGDGRAIAKINTDLPEVVKALIEAANEEPRKKHSAEIDLKIKIIAENGVANVLLEVKYKTPKKPPEQTVLWMTKDGYFSDEHPRQINMFPDRERSIDGGKTIDGEATPAVAAGGSAG